MGVKSDRAAYLARFVGVEYAPAASTVADVACRLVDRFSDPRSDPWHDAENRAFTSKGRAVAADFGLLMIRVIEELVPDGVVWWLFEGHKRDPSFQRPVVRALNGGGYDLDPLGMGIAWGGGVIRSGDVVQYLEKATNMYEEILVAAEYCAKLNA